MSTAKRQRQKAARQARLQAEERARKRKKVIKRGAILLAVAVLVIVIVTVVTRGGGKKPNASTTTTTTATTAKGSPALGGDGGSGTKTLAAETTSADCPSSFTATLNKPSWATAPPMTIDTAKTYTAVVTTDVGSFTIQLDPKEAPKTVNNFVFLAEHHFYDCVVFQRVIQGFMDQTGDPTGTGDGGPGYKFDDELPAKASPQYPLGSVAMANSGANTNGSQFFVVTGATGEDLPPSYSLFGKVTSGMDVVQKINADGSASSDETGTPTTLHRMVSVTISES